MYIPFCSTASRANEYQADWEGEGFDRPTMSLPPNIDDLITRVLKAAPNTIIVNQSGTPISMPWEPLASSLVQAWYGGNETGNGIADVLFGDFNPCAKLPLSWPGDIRDTPAFLNFGSTKGRVLYGEDVYLGYKYYDKVERQPLFGFGYVNFLNSFQDDADNDRYGLSYTKFALSNLTIVTNPQKGDMATVRVKNTGKVAGSEILQLYISAPNSPTQRPVRELHGFEKVFLRPGEERLVRVSIDKYATSFWDEDEEKWCSEQGIYTVTVNGSNGSKVEADLKVASTTYWLGL